MEHILNIWPTSADLAADMGVPYTTAASWRLRGSIPAKHDLDLIAAAARRGHTLSLETLAQMRRSRVSEAS